MMLHRSTMVVVALFAIVGIAVVESKPVPDGGMMEGLRMVELTTAIPLWNDDGGVFQIDVSGIETFPAAYRAMLPEFGPVFEFVESLTTEEKALLKKGIHLKDWKEFTDLEEVHPSLYAKFTKLNEAAEAKFDSLHPDAKAFLDKIGSYMMAHRKELLSAAEQPNSDNPLAEYSSLIRYLVQEFSKLSEAGQSSLRREFPGMMAIAESPFMKLFYNEVVNSNGRIGAGGLRIDG